MNTKVRLVRCPRCRNVLQEPLGVPVYRCGGCATALQAKKRKNGSDDQVIASGSNQQSPDNSIGQNRMDGDHDVDAPLKGVEENSSGKWKMEQLSDDQEAGSSSNQESLVTAIDEPDRAGDHNDLHIVHEDPQSLPEAMTDNRMDQDQDATKMQPSGGVEEYSSGKLKTKQLSDYEGSNQQSLVKSINDPDRNTDHNDPRSSTELSGHEDPESSPEATAHNRMDQHKDQDHDQVEDHDDDDDEGDHDHDHSSGKLKMEQFSDDQEAGSRLNQRSQVVRNSEHNEPRCSSELSYHNDPESSPEAAVHNRIDHDHDLAHDQVRFANNGGLGNHEIGDEFEESSSFSELIEIEEPSHEAISNMKIVRDSDGGSKSSFKSLIAEKLLDTRQKKVVYLDDDDTISEDGSADLCHRRRFEPASSAETLENERFGGTSYYGYEGSISSFDGNGNQIPRKKYIVPKGDEYVNSKNVHNYKRRNGRRGNGSSVIPENPKMERLELLKMVRELQDQLERTNVSNVAPQVPLYHNHGLNHPGRYGPRMAYSGETTAVNRRRDGGSCYHCYPQDRRFSAQLPRQCVYCNGPRYEPTTCYPSHCSGLSSPQHHPESEFLEPVDHQRWNDVRKQYGSPKKRYVRPIAAGSPWITCYRCSQLIQLPQSFLVFKRRCHSVRCGGCLKVLNFTLSNGTHVSRYYPEETMAAPPSSEVEDYANSRVGPVSCSDRSFQKSYSTETDRNGSREFVERRKAVLSRDPSDSAGPSSSKISGRRKTTSEIEPAAGGSPLHWLMGYASPSKVIRGSLEF